MNLMSKQNAILIILSICLFSSSCVSQSLYNYCKPANGDWLYDKCSDCIPCDAGCPENSFCAKQVNCENYQTLCGSQPLNPTKKTCPDYQFWNQTTQQCEQSQFGWCISDKYYNYTGYKALPNCNLCKRCAIDSQCEEGETCNSQVFCGDLYNYCSDNYTEPADANCAYYEYWDGKECLPSFGYCNPDNDNWPPQQFYFFYPKCDQCTPCLKDDCYKDRNCGILGGIAFCEYPEKTCNKQNSIPNPKCTDYQFWNGNEGVEQCINIYGWCAPPTKDQMFESCSQCVPVTSYNFTCPEGLVLQTDNQVYCGDFGTHCGWCENNQTVCGRKLCEGNYYFQGYCQQSYEGWCKPIDSWMYENCTQCLRCPSTGVCPGGQQCVGEVNCNNDWNYTCDNYTQLQSNIKQSSQKSVLENFFEKILQL